MQHKAEDLRPFCNSNNKSELIFLKNNRRGQRLRRTLQPAPAASVNPLYRNCYAATITTQYALLQIL
ncbi:hypothetical protein C7B79_16500 [Chroococcidiopsis cubana CCALA 043]|nr:hypothetical protein C7B79_16500 [Chroococcidiopsis cubana CCALA 043]